MIRVDPRLPVHRQPTLTVRQGGRDCYAAGMVHEWFSYAPNGVWCKRCDRLLVRITGLGRYRGRHRA